jgi:hypothetical protein
MDAKNTLFPHPVSYLVGVPCRRSHQFSGRSGATSTSTSRSKEANNESINQSTIKSTLQCTLHYSVHYTTVYTTLTASWQQAVDELTWCTPCSSQFSNSKQQQEEEESTREDWCRCRLKLHDTIISVLLVVTVMETRHVSNRMARSWKNRGYYIYCKSSQAAKQSSKAMSVGVVGVHDAWYNVTMHHHITWDLRWIILCSYFMVAQEGRISCIIGTVCWLYCPLNYTSNRVDEISGDFRNVSLRTMHVYQLAAPCISCPLEPCHSSNDVTLHTSN